MPRPKKKSGLLFERKNTIPEISPDIPEENVLSLRKKIWKIEFDPTAIKTFFSMHQKPLGIIGFVIFALTLSTVSFHTQANVATFYPTSCLGGWENPIGAQGEPDVKDPKDPTSYTTANSAVLENSTAQLFCGHFQGEIPKDVSPKKFLIKLAWSVDDGSVVHPKPQPIEAAPVTHDDPSPLPAEETPPPSVMEGPDVPLPSEVKETVPEEAPPAEDTSAFQFPLISRALAQTESPEVAPPSEPTPEPVAETTPAPDPVVENTSNETEITPPAVTSENEVPEVTEETPVVPDDASSVPEEPAQEIVEPEKSIDQFMVVRYTLDGENWETVGTVGKDHWQDVEFEIPRDKIPTWKDLSTVQVSLTPIQSFDKSPVVYIDALSINVEYEEIKELQEPPKIILKDSSLLFDGATDFNGTDTPTFIITDPGLTTDDINQLVADNKAEIVEDKGNVLEGEVTAPPAKEESSLLEPLKDILKEETPPSSEEKKTIEESITSFLSPRFAEAEESEPAIVSAVILDAYGNETDITVTITTVIVDGRERQQIQINRPERAFRPGRYTLQISLQTPQVVIITEQDFTWGVLAINIDKSMYLTGDTATIAMGVLNDKGNTICDANLVLEIKKPSGEVVTLSTENGTIIDDDACGPNNIIEVPDYHTTFLLSDETGTYHMKLMATTDNGTRSINDQFDVVPNAAFDVSRSGPTRINPTHTYPMTMRITPANDWSGKVKEIVPASFEVTPPVNSIPYESVEEENGVKVITWNLDLVAGEESVIGYYLKAPPVSPEFYFLGPLAFYDEATDTKLFQEKREWQVASDLVCTSQVTTGNWNTAGTWNCGHVPTTGEDVVIRSTDTITMDVNSAVLATITINGTLNTSNGTARSLSGTTLTIASTGTLIANASTITLSGTTAPIVTFTSGATFTVGTSTVTLTGNADMTAPIVGTNSFYNLTLGPREAEIGACRST